MKNSIESTIIQSSPILIRLAGKFTSDLSEKEDLVQETFIKSLKYIEKFQDSPKLITWLFVIMKTIYLNRYRRLNIHRQAQKVISTQMNNSEESNIAESKFTMEDIETVMKGLSEENYSIFYMYFEGYKYREIATYFNMKEGTVKTRIHTIQKLLKEKLKQYRKL